MNAEWQAPNVSLPDLVALERWQRLQDQFADVLGLGLRTCDASRQLLVAPSWPASFDAQTVTALFDLGEELEALLPMGALPSEVVTVLRPSGISFAACPLRAAADAIVAYLVVGPMILGRRETADHLRERAGLLRVDPAVLWTSMLTIKRYSFGAMRPVLRLLEDVSHALLERAYQLWMLRAPAPDAARVDRAVDHETGVALGGLASALDPRA